MQFTRELNHLMRGLLAAFVIISLSAAYWAMTGADTILQREDNPRLVEADAAVRRGTIYSRHGTPLAQTVVLDDLAVREYNYESTYSALGYYSLRYGVGGAEAAYNDFLSGNALPDSLDNRFAQDVLHRPQEGADIRLTFDLDIQQAVADAMGNRRGAVIVLSMPDGGIFSLLSQPTYNPNTLNDEWDQLVKAEGNPFFNRALQGQYQPGGTLQTPLMAAAVLTEQSLTTIISDANRPVRVDDIMLTCAAPPPQDDLTYIDAYAYACPYPFLDLANQINDTRLHSIFDALRLNTPPALDGFTVDIPNTTANNIESTPESTAIPADDTLLTLTEEILGQGKRTINPLGMAALAGAIINEGDAPVPYALMAIRPPAGDWQPILPSAESVPLMTSTAARRMRDLMQQNIRNGAATAAGRDDLPIGGHAALAHSGEEIQAWFIGFISLEDNRGAVVAVVLEDTDHVDAAAEIGGTALAAAYRTIQAASRSAGDDSTTSSPGNR